MKTVLVEIYDDTTGKKLEFKYDYMGRRVEKKVYTGSSTTSWALSADLKFVYDGYKLIEVLDGQNSDAILQKFLWSGDELLSVYDTAASATYYYFADANKNIGQLMDSSGNIVAKYEYSPFGVQTLATGTYASTNPFRFSSEYYDSETQLVYYNYRYYSPLLGRWLSRDPIEEDGGYNLYGFIDNNPVDYWDYLGMDYSTPWNPNGFPDYPPGFLPNNISPNDFTDDGMGPEAATLAITGLGSLLGNYFMMRNDGSSIAGALYNSANLTYNPLRGMFEAFSGIDFGYENPGGQLSSLDRWSRGLTSLGETLLFAAAGLEAARSCPACKANIGREAVSTGRTTANNMMEQMAMDAAKKGAGKPIERLSKLSDPRFKGMQKWQYHVKSASGKSATIHYVKDPATGKMYDFKFVN